MNQYVIQKKTAFSRSYFWLFVLVFCCIGFIPASVSFAQSCVTQYNGSCETQTVCNAQIQQGTHKLQENAGCTADSVCCVPSQTTSLSGAGKGSTTEGAYRLINPLGQRSVSQIIAAIIRYASVIAGGLFMGYLIWGGIEWMTARGDGNMVKSAQGKIIYSIVGIVVMFLSYFIIDALIRLTNLV